MDNVQYPLMYFGVAHQFFVDKIQNEPNEEKKKFLANVADAYSNVSKFISYPAQAEKHKVFGNLTSYILNNVFVDNLLSIQSQYQRLKKFGKVDETVFQSAIKDFHAQNIIEDMLSYALEQQSSTLPLDVELMNQSVFVSKIQQENKNRLDAIVYERNLVKSNELFIESIKG